jgi:hypothetical protein
LQKNGKQTNSRRKTFIYTMYNGDHLVKARSSGDGARDLGGGGGMSSAVRKIRGCSYLRRSALELPLGGVAREPVGV